MAIHIRQSIKPHLALLVCYLIMATPAILYFYIPMMKLFLPFWTILYVVSIIEMINKNDVLKMSIYPGVAKVKRLTRFKVQNAEYKMSELKLITTEYQTLATGSTLRHYELVYCDQVVGRFNDNKFSWDQGKLKSIVNFIKEE